MSSCRVYRLKLLTEWKFNSELLSPEADEMRRVHFQTADRCYRCSTWSTSAWLSDKFCFGFWVTIIFNIKGDEIWEFYRNETWWKQNQMWAVRSSHPLNENMINDTADRIQTENNAAKYKKQSKTQEPFTLLTTKHQNFCHFSASSFVLKQSWNQTQRVCRRPAERSVFGSP